MILPFDRHRLADRNRLDAAAEVADAARRSPAELVELTLALSNLVRELAHANHMNVHPDPDRTLASKARLWAYPLRALCNRGD